MVDVSSYCWARVIKSVIIQTRKVKVYVNLIISKLSMKALDKLLQRVPFHQCPWLLFIFSDFVSRLNFIMHNNITVSNHTSWTHRIYYHKIHSLFPYVYFSKSELIFLK